LIENIDILAHKVGVLKI